MEKDRMKKILIYIIKNQKYEVDMNKEQFDFLQNEIKFNDFITNVFNLKNIDKDKKKIKYILILLKYIVKYLPDVNTLLKTFINNNDKNNIFLNIFKNSINIKIAHVFISLMSSQTAIKLLSHKDTVNIILSKTYTSHAKMYESNSDHSGESDPSKSYHIITISSFW